MAFIDLRLLEGITVPVLVLDREGSVIVWNGAHSAIVGYPSNEAIGRHVREFLTAESGARLVEELASLSAKASPTRLELDWKTEAGAVTTLAFSAQLVSCTADDQSLVVMTGASMPVQRDPDPLQIFAFAPVGILVLGPNGRLELNHRAEEILGMRLSSTAGNEQYLPLIRRPDGTLLSLDELPSTRALRHGELASAEELLVRRPDGTEALLRASVSPVFGPEGGIAGCVLLFDDVTARMQSEAAIRGSYAKYEEIVAQAADAIIAVDPEQRIVLFNRGAETIFGWSAQEAMGQTIDILTPPRARERHRAAIDAFARGPAGTRRMAQGRPAIVGLRKNGDEFPLEADIYKMELAGAILPVAILRDISARKRQENQQIFLAHVSAMLASSLEYDETLMMVARLAVPLLGDCCIVDLLEEHGVRRLKVVHVDPGMAPLATALEAVQIRERHAHPIWQMLEEQRPVLLQEIPAGYLDRIAQSPEHLRLLQELAPVSLISVPLVARSHVLGALSFCSVRPERIYGEEDLRLAEELAGRAALALENSQLYTLAQRAIRARDEILGVVAHDLRNPLNTVQLTAEVLLHKLGGEQPKIVALVQSMLRATDRANRLIRDLLDVVRIESGHLAVERAPCQPGDLLDDALETMRPGAENASIELTGVSQPGLPQVEADHGRILQVFSNLVGNAIKFTRSGGRVSLGATRSGDDVCFSVSDTGPGIAADHLPHLFDRFWQARPADRRGAGLGLAIAKGIVEAHGGRIWAESTPGAGSTFFFTIPMLPSSAPRS